jgi:hypothetical protein
MGENLLTYLSMPGRRSSVNLMKLVQRDHKLDSCSTRWRNTLSGTDAG